MVGRGTVNAREAWHEKLADAKDLFNTVVVLALVEPDNPVMRCGHAGAWGYQNDRLAIPNWTAPPPSTWARAGATRPSPGAGGTSAVGPHHSDCRSRLRHPNAIG